MTFDLVKEVTLPLESAKELMQVWSSFCRMLKKYVDIVGYSCGFSDISIKDPFQPSVEKQSYATVKSKISNQSIPRSGKMVPRPTFSHKGPTTVSVRHPPSIQKQWLIKNHEVAKLNFDSLWIISKPFASDD